MAVNRSKVNDPRMHRKWEASGAIGRMEDAVAGVLAARGGLRITALTKHHEASPYAGTSLLGLGREVIDEGVGWRSTRPALNISVEGHNFTLGQELRKLPRGYSVLGKTGKRA